MKASSFIFMMDKPLQSLALCWVLIKFIAIIIRVRVRVRDRVRIRVSDIKVKNFRVKET